MKKSTLLHRMETKKQQQRMKAKNKMMSKFEKEKKQMRKNYERRLENYEREERLNYEKTARIHKEGKEQDLDYQRKVKRSFLHNFPEAPAKF